MSGRVRRGRLLCGVAGASLALAACQAEAAPRALSEAALDGVVAGSAGSSPAGSAAGTNPLTGQGGRGGSGGEAGGPVSPGPRAGNPPAVFGQSDPPDMAVPGRREAIVGHDSELDLRLDATVRVTDGTQSELRALSLVNASAADAASALNVFDGKSADTGGRHLLADQHNEIVQLETVGASLGAFSVAGETVTRRANSAHRSVRAVQDSMSETVTDIDFSRITTRGVFDANIPADNPLQNFEVNLGFDPPAPLVLPGWGFDGIVTVDFGELGEAKFGAAAEVGPTTFELGGLSLGRVRFEGDDIVIGQGSVTLPAFDFPGVTGTVCVVACASETFDIPRVGGQTASLPIPEFRLEGANPFKDFDLKVGQGIAAVGSGSFSFDSIGASMNVGLSLELPDLNETISFTVPGLFDGDPVDISIPITLELPDVDADWEVFSFEGPGFSDSFGFSGSMEDAVVCIALTTQTCGSQSFEKTEFIQRIDNRSTTSTAFASSFEEWSESREQESRPGAELREAEAELIAMSGAEARVNDYSLVIISGEAQRGLRAMNVANVTTAMVGSAANVARTPAAGGSAGFASGALTQTNIFIQGFTAR